MSKETDGGLKDKTREHFEIMNGKRKIEVAMRYINDDTSTLHEYEVTTKSRVSGNVVGRGEFRIWTLYKIDPLTGKLDSLEGLIEPTGKDWDYKREAIRSIIYITPNPEHEAILREYIAEQLREARKKFVQPTPPNQTK